MVIRGSWRSLGACLLVAAIVGGCAARPESPTGAPSPTSSGSAADDCASRSLPTFATGSGFVGANAFGHVLRIVCDFGTVLPSIRDRSPGTPGRAAVASYLADVLGAHGWRVTRQDFTGREYMALDKGSVSSYAEPDSCPAEDLARLPDLQFENVVAELGHGPALWILMAHYEAKAGASSDPDPANRGKPVLGANDGASGVGVWLEASRILTAPSGATLRILFDDGEDGFEDCHPLAGAVFHARTMTAEDRARTRGIILLDMVGDPQAAFCYADDAASLRDAIVSAASGLGVRALADAPACTEIDDQTAFTDVGLPAIDVIDARAGRYPPYWHTLADVPARLSTQALGDVGRVVVRTVEDLASR